MSDHPDIAKLSQSWVALASRMAQIMGRDAAEELRQATQAAREHGYGGILRSGDDMILQSLKRTSLKSSHYELPKGVQMVGMPTMGGAAAPPQGSGQGPYGAAQSSSAREADEEDLVSESAREISKTARDEATESAKDSLRKAIRGLW